MSWFQVISAGPWVVWLTKLLLFIEIALLSRNWAQQILSVYHSGPLGEAGLAVGLGAIGFLCLNGIFEGFDRGNMLGFVAGCLGIFLIGKVCLMIFAPSYLMFLPF